MEHFCARMQGLRAICSWSARVQQQLAWKYSFPTPRRPAHADAGAPGSACSPPRTQLRHIDACVCLPPRSIPISNSMHRSVTGANGSYAVYEAAIRYNYTAVEKSALVDTISMIKTLCTLMLRDHAIIAPLLRCQVPWLHVRIIFNCTQRVVHFCSRRARFTPRFSTSCPASWSRRCALVLAIHEYVHHIHVLVATNLPACSSKS